MNLPLPNLLPMMHGSADWDDRYWPTSAGLRMGLGIRGGSGWMVVSAAGSATVGLIDMLSRHMLVSYPERVS